MTPGLGVITAGTHRRLPAIEGLRALAIAAVIAYHLSPGWLPGGYLGVDVFFVVSGFLITGILLDLMVPSRLNARPALRSFWARRARRVIPAVVALVVGVAVLASLFATDAVPRLRADIPAALGFVANWRLLLHKDSYFTSWGRPPLLLHLWSLGVEEQFYILWPLVILFVAKLSGNPERTIARLAIVGAVASAVVMGWLYTPGHDGSSVYYNTFTHSSGLLIGTALCAATRHGRAASGPRASRRRTRTGAIALVGLLVCMTAVSASGSLAYRGGIFVASALTGIVVATSVHPGPLERLLGAPILRYLGTRSYSLYLWHWPIICLTRPGTDVALSGATDLVLRLALTLVAGELSYRFIEQPFRTGQVQSVLRGLRAAPKTAAVGSAGLCVATAVAVLAVSSPAPMPPLLAAGSTAAARAPIQPVTSTATSMVPSRKAGATRDTSASTEPLVRAGSSGTSPTFVTSPTPVTTLSTSVTGTAVTGTAVTGKAGTTASVRRTSVASGPRGPHSAAGRAPTTVPARSSKTTAAPSTMGATSTRVASAPAAGAPARSSATTAHLSHPYLAIGDSILLAAAAALEAQMHGQITIDAAVGRQVAEGVARLAAYRRAGDLQGLKGLVIDLGSNGPLTPAEADQMRALATDVPVVVFVNVRVPRPWQAETNASIRAVSGQPGVRVVDWYDASATRGVFWSDGVHPGPRGQLLYARLVSSALRG